MNPPILTVAYFSKGWEKTPTSKLLGGVSFQNPGIHLSLSPIPWPGNGIEIINSIRKGFGFLGWEVCFFLILRHHSYVMFFLWCEESLLGVIGSKSTAQPTGKLTWRIFSYPIGSMYGIFTYIWLIFMVNVSMYTIHWVFGYSWVRNFNIFRNAEILLDFVVQ